MNYIHKKIIILLGMIVSNMGMTIFYYDQQNKGTNRALLELRNFFSEYESEINRDNFKIILNINLKNKNNSICLNLLKAPLNIKYFILTDEKCYVECYYSGKKLNLKNYKTESVNKINNVKKNEINSEKDYFQIKIDKFTNE